MAISIGPRSIMALELREVEMRRLLNASEDGERVPVGELLEAAEDLADVVRLILEQQ